MLLWLFAEEEYFQSGAGQPRTQMEDQRSRVRSIGRRRCCDGSEDQEHQMSGVAEQRQSNVDRSQGLSLYAQRGGYGRREVSLERMPALMTVMSTV